MERIVTYFKNLPEKEAAKFLIIFYVVGITGFLVPPTRYLFELMISLSLCINLFMLFLFHKPFNLKHLLFFAGVILFTFVVEAVGVKTGFIFGDYFYGSSLFLKIFETPLLIGFNWLMLTYGVVQLLRINSLIRKFSILLGALLMTGFDFVMEPVAVKTDMWSWASNVIPLQNYLGWFIVSAIIISGFELLKIKTDNKIAGRIFILQFIFFVALNLFLQ